MTSPIPTSINIIMKRKSFQRFFLALSLLIILPASVDGDPFFPGSGTDAQCLGRGGTIMAVPPGKNSALGNPATLTPKGSFALGAEYLRAREADEGTWVISLVDTSSSIRGALTYFSDPGFAGFEKNLWGIAFAQALNSFLTLGEGFHTGEYEDSEGDGQRLSAADLGILLGLGERISLGYLARNVYRSDKDLLDSRSGFGAAFALPWDILLAIDIEDSPLKENDEDLRVGMEIRPLTWLACRFGYQDIAGQTTYYTAGVSYFDANGSLDAAILFNEETDKTDRIIIGFTMGM